MRLAESLVLVWVLIRLRSLLVRDERLARAIAIFAWIIAALNIAGLITPVIVSWRMKVTPSTAPRWVQQGRRKPHLAAPMNLERVNALWVLLAAAARVATKAFDDRLKIAETAEARS